MLYHCFIMILGIFNMFPDLLPGRSRDGNELDGGGGHGAVVRARGRKGKGGASGRMGSMASWGCSPAGEGRGGGPDDVGVVRCKHVHGSSAACLPRSLQGREEEGFTTGSLELLQTSRTGPFQYWIKNTAGSFELFGAFKHLQKFCKFLGSLFILI